MLEQIVTWFTGMQRRMPAPPVVRPSQPAAGESRPLARRFDPLSALWNRGLPAEVQIAHRVIWPLFLLPIVFFNQLVAPHPVWVVLGIALIVIYSVALIWVRGQARAIAVHRKRSVGVFVAGDSLRQEFELSNSSPLPVLWAEWIDHSTLPGYSAGRVVGCGANSSYRWHMVAECRQRGVYQLGPHELRLADPLALFQLTIHYNEVDVIVIYPRVAHLPIVALPHGETSGAARRRRPLTGPLPSASVRDYRATDSLRYVHWPLTAHRGSLMVKELEIEPSGGVWIVLDLNAAAHRTVDEVSTLEFSIVVAASLAAELLTGGDSRAVGLLTVSGHEPLGQATSGAASTGVIGAPHPALEIHEQAVLVPPQAGPAQIWRILAALAPVQPTDVPLAELLRTSRSALGRRGTVVVVTPQIRAAAGEAPWTAELLHLESAGLAGSAVLIAAPDDPADAGAALRTALLYQDVPVQLLRAGMSLPSALTFRRTRKVVRSTPTGGAVTYEVEEEVS
ncbi:MAG: hypothetical protein DCC55_10395 [Chloroflexi bacterium]|nr:MAG: hypothetical protein DCC55_10395 [Chloroflexota bacterium]